MSLNILESILHNTFVSALREFIEEQKANTNKNRKEKILNRHLFQKINNRNKLGTLLIECPVQPSENDDTPLPREEKKPDMTLRLVDYEAGEHLDYHIECKRLGKPHSQYCRNYIRNGIERFIDEQWGYGCFTDLGFMIGYIQDTTFRDVFEAVNRYASDNDIPPLIPDKGEQSGSINYLKHILDRRGEFSEFRLKHYWANITVERND